jgi:hypothetical protein
MFCRNCGAQNDDNAMKCARCGGALGAAAASDVPAQTVPNYLVHAILVTIFCCLPFGIVGIVYAAQVNSKLAGGDYQGALDSSGKAKTWTLVGFLCGLVATLLYVSMMILGIMAGGGQGMNQ